MKKKIILGVCMLGFIAMMATSCKKNEETTTSFLFDEVPMEVDDMNNDGRFYFDPSINNFIWETTDCIKVYNADNNQSAQFRVTNANGTSMTMTGPVIGSTNNMYAFFPYEMASAPFDVEDMRQTFTVGNVDIEHNTFNNVFYAKNLNGKYTICDAMFPKAAKKANGKFSFKNFFGVAKLFIEGKENPNGGDNVKIVGLKIVDNAFNLWGTVSLRPFELSNGGDVKLKAIMQDYIDDNVQFASHENWSWVIGDLGYCASNDGNREIELLFSEAGEPEVTNQAVVCYFGLRPGALGKGFKLFVELDNGQTIECDEYSDFNPNNIFNRNWVVQNGKIKDYTFNIANKIVWN